MLQFVDTLFILGNIFENLEPIVILRFLNDFDSSSYGSINKKKIDQTIFLLGTGVSFVKWKPYHISNANLVTNCS